MSKIEKEKSNQKSIYKDFIFWYMIVSPLTVLFTVLINYNHPNFGFNEIGYGLGVAVIVLFPAIWLLIYLFCKIIAEKNEFIEDMERSIENSEELEVKTND